MIRSSSESENKSSMANHEDSRATKSPMAGNDETTSTLLFSWLQQQQEHVYEQRLGSKPSKQVMFPSCYATPTTTTTPTIINQSFFHPRQSRCLAFSPKYLSSSSSCLDNGKGMITIKKNVDKFVPADNKNPATVCQLNPKSTGASF